MNKELLNNELEFAYPDGFGVMGPEEVKALNTFKEGPGWCIKDPDRHMIITVAWKKAGGLTSLLAGTKDVAKSFDSSFKKLMAPYGYVLEGYVEGEIAGRKYDGIKYHYTAQDIEMYGESLSVKNGKNYYYVHFYARQELREASDKVMENILTGSSWK